MKPAREVVEDALRQAPESEARWEHVSALRRRHDEETFRTAVGLLDSDDPVRRELGTDILAQLGAGDDDRPYARPTAELLTERIAEETHPEVLQAMATAFGHLDDPACIPVLYELRHHPSEDVRYGVVFGLLGHDEDRAVEALVELSADPDADVRDWATFGLGAMIERDDDEVRAALLARLDDPHVDTRSEAINGLAERGDARAIEPLLELLDGHPVEPDDLGHIEGDSLVALAVHTRDERLCPLVAALRSAWLVERPGEPMADALRAALKACAIG